MSRHLPPVGVHSTVPQDGHCTTVWECEKMVVMVKQPWHLTSMKNELGDCTRRLSLCFCCSSALGGFSRSMSLCRTILIAAIRKDEDGSNRVRRGRAGGPQST